MDVQTNYDLYARTALAGMHATTADSEFATKSAMEEIPFGKAVVRGDTDESTRLPVDDSSKFLGIAVRNIGTENYCNGEKLSYLEKEAVAILRRGTVYVRTETSVAPGDAAFFRITADGTKLRGSILSNDDSGKAVKIPGATFESTTEAGGIALLRIYGGLV